MKLTKLLAQVYLNFLGLHLEKDRLILYAPKLNFASLYIYQGVTQAEKLAKLYKTKWQYNVDPVFREFIY